MFRFDGMPAAAVVLPNMLLQLMCRISFTCIYSTGGRIKELKVGVFGMYIFAIGREKDLDIYCI